ncbi:hypothetical protein D8674_018151 [Pyrus ussuriensis x Pyrus communis]|uniref:Uncharacterized protein n=1 Tax=Pyrus ussuriensis x Pyrus communis TaxID=2448454 RepID=A0A5N5G3Y3_9ROSA|nr:hypothetical protein D8674_018151 [Pyrus ussuriensis x Pyrus communis]
MKREGRQHGMVRTYRILPEPLNPRPATRHINKSESPPTAGLFTKVPTKPTNHSKFTGKCGKSKCTDCHIHPASKAKEKTKGNQKLKSSDVVSNHRLVTWRVVDGQTGLNNQLGLSATEMLDHLSNDYENDHDIGDDGHEINGYAIGYYDDGNDDRTVENHVDDVDHHGVYEEMGFFNVDYVVDHQIKEDDGWCLVPQT